MKYNINEVDIEAKVQRITASEVSVEIGGKTFDFEVLPGNPLLKESVKLKAGESEKVHHFIRGQKESFLNRKFVQVSRLEAGQGREEKLENQIVSPMPGKVFRCHVKAGDTFVANQTLMVVEAMKMEHALKSPQAGKVVKVLKGEGDQVQAGELLAELEFES